MSVRVWNHSVVGVATLALLLTSTAAGAQAVNSTADTSLWETRVFVNETCPSSQAIPPVIAPILIALATALLPKVIDFGVSYANRALQRKADEEKAKNNAVQAGGLGWLPGFYRHQIVDGKPGLVSGVARQCLIIVRGSFAGEKARAKPCTDYPHTLSTACEWLRKSGVKDVGIYLESQFILADDGASFRLQPERLIYVKPISSKPSTTDGAAVGTYDLNFTINFEAPSATTSAVTPFGLGVLSFEQIRPVGEYDRSVLAGKSSGWTAAMPITAIQMEINRVDKLYSDKKAAENKLPVLKKKPDANPQEIADLEESIKSLDDQISAWSKEPHPLGPTNIVVKMTERPHLPQNLFFLTAAEVFAASKSDISKAISDNLNQAIIAATPQGQATNLTQEGALVIAALEASKIVDQKQAALDQLPQDASDVARKTAARDLEIAKIKANIAYVAAGRAPPYPDAFGG